MSKLNNKIPALIFGSSLTVLGVIRNLGRLNIPIFCVETQADTIQKSKFYHPGPKHFDPNKESMSEWLEASKFEKAVIIPCSDNYLKETADLPDDLKQTYLSSIPDSNLIELFTDKEKFANLNQRLNIPAPISYSINSVEKINSINDTFFEHAFLKPIDSQLFGSVYKKKALQVNSKENAITQYNSVDSTKHKLLLQEYIPGDPAEHYFIDGFVDRHDRIKTMVARQRIRLYPFDFGNSSFLKSVPLRQVNQAVDSIKTIMANIDYRGIFSAEFKHDHRDDLYKIIEINARPWWFNDFPSRCGVNIIKMSYDDALGIEIEESFDYKSGKTFVYTTYDEPAASRDIKEGRLNYFSLWFSWFRSYKAIFNIDDISPFWHNLSIRIKRKINSK